MALIGRSLREARGALGITIEQAAHETRISPRFLQALETEHFEELPAPVYVRGFLRSYANYLHLDAEPLITELAANGNGPPIAGGSAAVAGARRGGPRGVVPADEAPARGATGVWSPQAPAAVPSRGRADPFQRRAGLAQAAAPAARLPYQDEEDDEWDDEPAIPPRRAAAPPPPAVEYEHEEDYEDEPPYARSRIAGVLLERPEPPENEGRGLKLLAGLGIAVVLVLGASVAVLLFSGDKDNGARQAAVPTTATPSKPSTVVALGSVTATASATGSPSAVASAVASAGASATASPTAEVSPSAASPTPATTPAATATPLPEAPTPTPDLPTPTPPPATEAPTSPPVVPTPTPTRAPLMTPTPTTPPLPPHPYSTALCVDPIDGCGTKPYTVVCPPDGSYYIIPSYNASYPRHGWPVRSTSDISAASKVCG